MRQPILFLSTSLLLFSLLGCTKSKDESQSNRAVFFKNITEGQTVPEEFVVRFSATGIKTRPAGEDPSDKNSGHHHILIDHPNGFIKEGQVIPKDENNLHFGKGETEATLNLSKGKHKISLQFGDGAHISYGKALSETVEIDVQ